MPHSFSQAPGSAAGIWVRQRPGQSQVALYAHLCGWLEEHGLEQQALLGIAGADGGVQLRLAPDALAEWAPGFDTLDLARRLELDSAASDAALEREIAVALLAAPQPMVFSNLDELEAALGVRRHIARAGARTALAFNTQAAERPEAFWHYDEDQGFLLNDGAGLIDALRAATQPEATGRLYDFSCYRATEYVILLGMAQELAERHPALLEAITQASRRQAIRSGRFHEVFLTEYGSMAEPLPERYYVPGDRVWFRNPDERSADIAGYEGSWVIYLGGGVFSNFWKRDQPYDFDGKCVEIHHWRDGAVPGPTGELVMDESIVERLAADTLADPPRRAAVLARMQRLRDGRGVWAEGGCIDRTREFPRQLCPGSATVSLPAFA